MSFLIKSKTALSLGLLNLWRVAKYRFGIKTGLNPVQKLLARLPSGTFFASQRVDAEGASRDIGLQAFGYLSHPYQGRFPNWFYSPLTDKIFPNSDKPWFQLPDFADGIGDIKGVWEASRFDWMFKFITLEQEMQDGSGLVELDAWLNDWCLHNPAYLGPNWKCGQEASIRVMHMMAVLMGLGLLHKANNNVLDFIEVHLQRIKPTIDYAIAQDNNHGTSEATALYIGGSLLNVIRPKPIYQQWQALGLKWLENRAQKLIMHDGGFSQYSVNYHRVMLDSYCLSELVRQQLNLPEFSANLYKQLLKATDWLFVLTQVDGDVPNLGANDGARLIPVAQTDYRDFRPSVQLASTLFGHFSYFQVAGSYDDVLAFFKVEKKRQASFLLPQKNNFYSDSGLITAEKDNFFLAFKLPIFKFRPSQSDVLHLDLWWKGINILRDGGTYSYNSTKDDLDYFSGVASHNTVQFDRHQQMPRLSRFLFGAWLKPNHLSYNRNSFSCGYTDYFGCQHKRSIILSGEQLIIEDEVSGFKEYAILRWRLWPDNWRLEGKTILNDVISLSLDSNADIDMCLTEGEESRYYYQKTPLPVLEITIKQSAKITTLIRELV